MKSLTFAALAIAALAAGAPQAESLLRRSLKADTVDTYVIVDRVNQTVKNIGGAENPANLKSERTVVLKTKSVDAPAGIASIETTTTFDKLEADGPMAGQLAEKPAPATRAGKMDVRGRITFEKTNAPDLFKSLMTGRENTLMAGTLVEFPEKAVKIGDSWDISVPKSPMLFDADQRLTAKLVGEKELDGVPVWVVSVSGLLRTAIDSSKIPGAKPLETPMGPMSVKITGQDELTGEGIVEKSTGRTLSMVTKSNSKKLILLSELDISIEATGTIESTATLKKPTP